MGIAVPFPAKQPDGYDWLDNEPVFSPDEHLALEVPDEIVMLADLGYTDEEIEATATPVAASSPCNASASRAHELRTDAPGSRGR